MDDRLITETDGDYEARCKDDSDRNWIVAAIVVAALMIAASLALACG